MNETKVNYEPEDTSITFKSIKKQSRQYNLPHKDVYELGMLVVMTSSYSV